jgi:hypothetical protein
MNWRGFGRKRRALIEPLVRKLRNYGRPQWSEPQSEPWFEPSTSPIQVQNVTATWTRSVSHSKAAASGNGVVTCRGGHLATEVRGLLLGPCRKTRDMLQGPGGDSAMASRTCRRTVCTLSRDWLTVDGVCVGNRIYWTLQQNLWLYFTVHYHTQTSVLSQAAW